MSLHKRVVQRFKGGGVIPLRVRVPTLAIHGRKYALSDYWPMFSDVQESMAPSEGGGARLLKPEGGNRFRYLWALDSDRKMLTMWRVSDGDEKVHDRMSSMSSYIHALEKKGQLNRVTHEEFLAIERFMHHRYEETLQNLKQLIRENEDDWDRRVKTILQDWFDAKLRPEITRRIAEVEAGVLPFGFKVNDRILEHKTPEQQAKSFVVSQVLGKFDQAKAYDIVSEAVGFDAYEPPQGDNQAVQWAWHELLERVYEEFRQ